MRFPDPVRAGDVVLTVDGLTKRLGDNPVLRKVGFTVGRGEVFLVVGPNGAGQDHPAAVHEPGCTPTTPAASGSART